MKSRYRCVQKSYAYIAFICSKFKVGGLMIVQIIVYQNAIAKKKMHILMNHDSPYAFPIVFIKHPSCISESEVPVELQDAQ